MTTVRRKQEWVLLGQAGYPIAAVEEQVERICASRPFDDQETPRKLLAYLVREALLGHVPQADEIASAFGSTGETFASTNTGRLRNRMAEFYNSHAKRDDIQLAILPKSYIVVAPRYFGTAGIDIPASARITEPADNSEVYARVTIRGRIDSLDPDLRVWVVVLADHAYYLQRRVSRRSPMFEIQNRPGRTKWGAYEGEEYSFVLIAADIDADFALQASLDRGDDGFGTRLPADTQVLHTVRVVRRDIRPGGPTIEPKWT